MPSERLPLRADQAPDAIDRELESLLNETLASAWVVDELSSTTAPDAVRGKLLERVSASRAASHAMFTSRLKRLSPLELAPGVLARTLYRAPSDRALRPGEPTRARLIELRPGARWSGPDTEHHREWLVLRGSIAIGEERLHLRDYHAAPVGAASHVVSTEEGALLFLRESLAEAGSSAVPFTVRDEDAGWPDFAPGVQRRVLWQHEGQAAMLYYAQPGASVPLHTHGHDEECLMVQGELFLDDVLLQEGDYQLAPAGTCHHVTETDTGVVVYAHGDLDLQFVG